MVISENKMQIVIDNYFKSECDINTSIKSAFEKGFRIGVKKASSAQPEILMCKDCKYYGCILYSGTQFEHGECFGHEESDYTFEVKPDDFCSRAERKTDGVDR